MATEIARSLTEIDQKVRELNRTLKDSTAETKELDKALKLDAKNTETVDQKMKLLQSSIGTATQKVAMLKQKQDLANEAMKHGDISADEYRKIELSVMKAENEVRALQREVDKTAKMKVDKLAASFDSLTGKLKKVEAAAKTLQRAAAVVLTALTTAAVAFVKIGDDLDDTSKKFSISAEQLQLQRNLYAKTTDDAGNYDRALSSLNSVMSSIARGRGAAYVETLKKLGVSTTDATGKTKSAAVVYDELIGALGRITDATERASLASIIFGDNGLNVANVAGLTSEQIAALNQQMIDAGLVSSEAATKAGEIADKLDLIKQQLSAEIANLMVALMPLILDLIAIAQETIIPILTTIAGWFTSMSPTQQKFVFFLLMLLIFLPKIISIVTAIVGVVKAITIACYGASGGLGAVSSAGMPLYVVIALVAAVVLTLVLLFTMLAGKSKDVTKELKQQQSEFESMQSSYSDMASDMDATANITSSNTNTKISQHNVNIKAEGNTPISKDTADLIADSLADKINYELGGKI